MTNAEHIRFMGRPQNEKNFHYEPYDAGIMFSISHFNVADRCKNFIYSGKRTEWLETARKTGQAAMLAAMEAAGVNVDSKRIDCFGNNIYRIYH